MRYLPKDDAPFADSIWDAIEKTVLGTAQSQLAGRKLLEMTGPVGLGVRVLENAEATVDTAVSHGSAEASLSAAQAHPIPLLRASFSVSVRDVAAAQERGVHLELRGAVDAALAVARLEEQLVFEGDKKLGLPGLLNASGVGKSKVGDWSKVGQAADDFIAAVNVLDAAGFPGPYAAALAPPLYNSLLLRYQQGQLTQLQHAEQIITAGIVKAPMLKSGGVVLAAGREFATLVVGQDMMVGFVGPAGMEYEFVVCESLAPRVLVPQAVCVLQPSAK